MLKQLRVFGVGAVVVATACGPSLIREIPPPPTDGGPGPAMDAGPPAAPDAGPRLDAGPMVERCETGDGVDWDQDGYPNPVDCNDCSPQINPGAYDVPGNGHDDDCVGGDAEVASCDDGLAYAPGSAVDAARAIGLCNMASPDGTAWGVLSARFTSPDGMGMPESPLQVGILPSFGVNVPREGTRLLALSSGVARAPGQEDFTSECDLWEWEEYDFPPTFPQPSSTCPDVYSGDVFDAVALEVQIRVPTNALGFSFNSGFFTYEFPEYICDEYNDFYAVLRDDGDGAWSNIVFDSDGNPVSVNNSLLQACEAGMAGGKVFACPLGRSPLEGTGYGNDTDCGLEGYLATGASDGQETGGATGWLRTVAPVVGGSVITLRFSVWDSGDGTLDSLAIMDAFEWELEPVMETETVPDLI